MNATANRQPTTAHPSPLPTSSLQAPDGQPFPWGPITHVHMVGPYAVIEYRRDASRCMQPEMWAGHGRTEYLPYIDSVSTRQSYGSLDSALVGAIAYRRCGPNSQAAHHFDLITLGQLPGGA